MASDDDDDPAQACHHYESPEEVPSEIRKYFEQRYQIFSAYDDGILMTDDAWFGVTPEPVALKIAEHVAIAAPADQEILIDCFAGVGGNAIAFALSERWTRVYAIEKDPAALKCARHNARIYGVEDKISWYEGDCFEILKGSLAELARMAVLFASPPWGGPGYKSDEIFDLFTMQPYSLIRLYESLNAISSEVLLYLPRSSDLRQISRLPRDGKKIMVMHYCMDGASKALCAYYGGFDFSQIEG